MEESKNALRIVTVTLFLLICCSLHVQAFDFDMTVDDDIRKNYNSSKLINDTNTVDFETLPYLPEKLKNETVKTEAQKSTVYIPPKAIITSGNVKMHKGTSFNVVNITKISDWQTKGAAVKFKTTALINKRGYTLPVSTVFTGEVIESHQPQVSCNGGMGSY